jgi:hypothetical protein
MNAIACLPHGDYSDHILYTTLEPCLLCSAAMAQVRIGRVRFAAANAGLVGIDHVPNVVAYVADRWSIREGPVTTALAPVSTLLNLLFWLQRNPQAGFVQAAAGTMPELSTAARALVASGSVDALKRLSPTQAFASLAGYVPD